MSRRGGFTLLEVLLSISILALLAGLSLPVYQSFLARNDIDIAATTIANGLQRARLYAQTMQYDTTWGVSVQSNTMTLFKGANFAARDTAYDETYAIPSNITATGASEIVFAKVTATPSSTGAINLANTAQSRTISINARGMVEY